MSNIYSPLDSLPTWNTELAHYIVPPGLRYSGVSTYAINATRSFPEDVFTPFQAVVRSAASSGVVTLELEILPFLARRAFQALKFGLPLFYIRFEEGAPDAGLKSGNMVKPGERLGKSNGAVICAVMPDGVTRDPLYWAESIDKAFESVGEDRGSWPKFVSHLKTQNADAVPILLMDHQGVPLESGDFNVSVGAQTQTVILGKNHHGDIRKAASEAGLLIPDCSATIEPAPPNEDWQLACDEDSEGEQAQITVTREKRHVLLTNLQEWFAEQYATASPPQDQLARYTRHNALTTFVNGNEFFKDIFQSLHEACGPGGGFHLAGWDMDPLQVFVPDAPPGAAPEFRTLKKVAESVGTPGELSCCFLPAKFVNLKADQAVENLTLQEKAGLLATLAGFSLFFLTKALNVAAFRTDGSGGVVLTFLLISLPFIVDALTKKDAAALEPNSPAVGELNAPPRSRCDYQSYPARIADNRRADAGQFPVSLVTKFMEQFNVYHQKFALVRTGGQQPKHIGYCGGVDFNPNRLDDANHLNPEPFHDAHARIEGPAVHDLALTFYQRWQLKNLGPPAIATPAMADLGQPGKMVAQVARTYFGPVNAMYGLPFAPEGDRTLLDTLLKAIKSAKRLIYVEDQYFTTPEEYQQALLDKVKSWVANGTNARLVIALPAVTDQPFGLTFRDPFIVDLLSAGTTKQGKSIVQVGFPMRRYTVPRCDLRASSGKLILAQNFNKGQNVILLGPVSRVPSPPFWAAVNGELMYVYDEYASSMSGVDPKVARAFLVDRGGSNNLLGAKKGPLLRDHPTGSAVTLVELSGIYVHAKLMIVDDVFLSIGSANINRRGLYSDGECNIFTMPESLRADPCNPVLSLRKRLWAEMLDLPCTLVEALLTDPVTSSDLFSRSHFLGNRFAPHDAVPSNLMGLAAKGGDSIVTVLLDALKFFVSSQYLQFFETMVDPSSQIEPNPAP